MTLKSLSAIFQDKENELKDIHQAVQASVKEKDAQVFLLYKRN